MERLIDIEQKYYEKLKTVRNEFAEELQREIAERYLNGDVVGRHGKVGRLKVVIDSTTTLGYCIKFFAYKKNGDLSSLGSEYCYNFNDYKKAQE